MDWLLAIAFLFSDSIPTDPSRLVIRDATVIDGTGDAPLTNHSILIERGVITAIAPSNELSPRSDDRIVDAAGTFVLPGLIDGHVHVTPWRDRDAQLTRLLESGVTTLRDMGGDVRIAADIRERVAKGALLAPDLHSSATFFGPLFLQDRRIQVAGSGFPPGEAPWHKMVTADTDLVQAVTDARASGAVGIKLYSEIDPPLARAIVAEAHRQGLKVWSHATIFPSKPGDAVAAGVDTIVHNGMLFPETQDGLPGDYHTGVRTWMAERDFSAVAPDAPVMSAFYEQMVERGTIYEPTLAGSERFAASNAQGSNLSEIDWDAMRDWGCAATGAAHRAGVTISAGTDTAGGASVHRELELLVACGLSPMDAIVAATRNAATSIGIDATHGTIDVGKQADLIILESDPLADIASIRSVRAVLKNGKLVLTADRD
ncbi:amidohydrolase family protein [Sphingomicrobium sp. XHP0239]|uniref:amidohydrolase family protein n=1 Tax=Sphingomicrobium maritimum TaxID=3133972 RepID=UPI0031CC4E37